MALTEFEYPGRMRELLAAIVNDLYGACREELAQAATHRDAGRSAAQAAFKLAQRRIEKAQEAELLAIRAVREEAATVLARIAVYDSKVSDHLVSHRIEFPAVLGSPTGVSHAEQGRGAPSERLRALGQRVDSTLLPLVNTISRRKRLDLWPKDRVAQWFIVLTSLILAFQWTGLLLWWPIVVLGGRVLISGAVTSDARRFKYVAESIKREATEILRAVEQALAETTEAIQVKLGLSAQLAFAEGIRSAEDAYAVNRQRIHDTYRNISEKLHSEAAAFWVTCQFAALPWQSAEWDAWTPDMSPGFAGRIGTFELEPRDLTSQLQEVDFSFSLPAMVPFSDNRCLLLSATGTAKDAAAQALQSVAMRALANTPPGKTRFTFIDPVALGHNVADFLALGDHAQALISGKAWTEPQHIERQLAELTEHMETVIQKYLRKDFATLHEYNEQAGEVSEPFRFLVIFDFPLNFTEAAARRLTSIVRNGPRCGVYTLIMRDASKPMPYPFDATDLEANSTFIEWSEQPEAGGRPVWHDPLFEQLLLIADTFSSAANPSRRVVETSGRAAVVSMKVEVPFPKLLVQAGLDRSRWWSATTEKSLRAPLGPSGVRRVQFLVLGEGLAHHGLIVGRTGSGKTNLMHVIITSLALTYSPQELQLYLIDLKGGVGFKPYARNKLPHATVIAIESEREFGLSVLQGLEAELKSRFEVFRAAGVDNLTDYRAKGVHTHAMPRVLLVIDEYQQLFTHDDALAAQARVVLDRIAAQGRSFGLHILLATQSLAGSASRLPPSTMAQLGVRVALPCGDADASVIFASDNLAARALSRPGEGIYNSAAGALDRNDPFQGALFTDGDLESYLTELTRLAVERSVSRQPVVFEGNEPAAIEDCAPLRKRIEAASWCPVGRAGEAWLGEPVAMRPPVRALFSRQAGRHLLVIDRDEAAGVGVLLSAWTGLLCCHRPTTAEFYVLDLSTAETPWSAYSEEMRSAFRQQSTLLSRHRHALGKAFEALVVEVRTRLDTGARSWTPRYLLILGLQRARGLRPSDLDFSATSGAAEPDLPGLLATILKDGPEVGVHVLAWCDTLQNAKRTVGRLLSEFGMRAAGPMTADDSNAFLDAIDAAKLDRPHRMLFFDEERPGILDRMRPYAVPNLGWLRSVASAQRQWIESM